MRRDPEHFQPYLPAGEQIPPAVGSADGNPSPDGTVPPHIRYFQRRLTSLREAVALDAALFQAVYLDGNTYSIPPVASITVPHLPENKEEVGDIATRLGFRRQPVSKPDVQFDIPTVVTSLQAVNSFTQQADEKAAEIAPKQTLRRSIQMKMHNAVVRQHELEESTGLRRIVAPFQKIFVTRRAEGLEKQETALAEEMRGPLGEISGLRQQAAASREKAYRMMGAYGAAEMKNIRGAYQEIIEELATNEILTAEVRERMHDTSTIPVTDEDVQKAIRSTASFVLASLCAEDLSLIKQTVTQHLSFSHISKAIFVHAAESAVSAPQGFLERRKRSFGDVVQRRITYPDPHEFLDYSQYPSAEAWDAFKRAPMAQTLFGDSIQELDSEIYRRELSEALEDREGSHIDRLRYYPTPEVIRTLAVIAYDRRPYPIHTNWDFAYMAERADWPDLLARTIELYPELAPLENVLLNWKYKDTGNNPALESVRVEFGWELIKTGPEDKKIRIIALRSLNTEYLLQLMKAAHRMSNEDAEQILSAERILRTHAQQISEEERRGFSYFTESVARSLRYMIDPDTREYHEPDPPDIDKYKEVAAEIILRRDDPMGLSYLGSGRIIEYLASTERNEQREVFLNAYQICPSLADDRFLTGEFIKQFEDQSTVEFFQKFADISEGLKYATISTILQMVREKKLSQERALALAPVFQDIPEGTLKIAKDIPELLLETDDGLALAVVVEQGRIFDMSDDMDRRAGVLLQGYEGMQQRKRDYNLLGYEINSHLEYGDEVVAKNTDRKVDNTNWKLMFMLYTRAQVPGALHNIPTLSEETQQFISQVFKTSEVRDLVSQNLRDAWISYLSAEDSHTMPYSITLLTDVVSALGAGQLSQVEAMCELMGTVRMAQVRSTTHEKTQIALMSGLQKLEERFVKERWSNDDRTNFYVVSKDIIQVSPSLYESYLSFFEVCSPQQLKKFTREIYPLHRAIIALSGTSNEEGEIQYSPRNLVLMRQSIRELTQSIDVDPEIFDRERQRLIDQLSQLFQRRFGIKEIPADFTEEHIRSLTNISVYTVNLAYRSSQNEAVLGYYLALMLNDGWEELRAGKTPDPTFYMTAEKCALVTPLLETRANRPLLTAEQLGIKEEDMPEFMDLLQTETDEVIHTSIETVDVKLINILRNLSTLEDLDLYTEAIDKQRMQLTFSYGNRKIGQVAANLYLTFAQPAKAREFSQEEGEVRDQLAAVLKQNGIELTAENVKRYLQDGMKPFAMISNLLSTMKGLGVEQSVTALREQLKPEADISTIFTRMGEEFTPTSGALALVNDLNYLDSLIVRKEDQLTEEEKKRLRNYIDTIRGQVVALEDIYGQVKNKFKSARQGVNGSLPSQIEAKFAEVESVIYDTQSAQVVQSIVSHDMNTIIENIRECLSCTKQGINNDTNLTFGDPNKFYVYSKQAEQTTGSIADEVVYLVPVIHSDGRQELSFVFDRLYGTNTPTILENQVAAVLKKYRTLRGRFPDIKLSLFVTTSAIHTAGTSDELFSQTFKEYGATVVDEEAEVEVKPSVFNDQYIEFGGDVRSAGPRKVRGLTITLPDSMVA